MIKGGLLMLADEYPAFNKSPGTPGGTAGIRAPADQFYGHRSACLRGPFGHAWTLSKEFESVAPEEMQRRWNPMADPDSSCFES